MPLFIMIATLVVVVVTFLVLVVMNSTYLLLRWMSMKEMNQAIIIWIIRCKDRKLLITKTITTILK